MFSFDYRYTLPPSTPLWNHMTSAASIFGASPICPPAMPVPPPPTMQELFQDPCMPPSVHLSHRDALIITQVQEEERAVKAKEGQVRVELADVALWQRFNKLHTEMVITKSGRWVFRVNCKSGNIHITQSRIRQDWDNCTPTIGFIR